MRAEFPDATHHCWAYVVGAIQQLLPSVEGEILGQAYGTAVEFTVRLPLLQLPALETAVLDLTRGAVQVRRLSSDDA